MDSVRLFQLGPAQFPFVNFELNVETLDSALAAEVDRMIDRKRASGREITLAMVDARDFPTRLRDGLARLLTPYL